MNLFPGILIGNTRLVSATTHSFWTEREFVKEHEYTWQTHNTGNFQDTNLCPLKYIKITASIFLSRKGCFICLCVTCIGPKLPPLARLGLKAAKSKLLPLQKFQINANPRDSFDQQDNSHITSKGIVFLCDLTDEGIYIDHVCT